MFARKNTRLLSREEKEESLEFKLPKDSFGEFDFKMEFNDGVSIVKTNKRIFLPSSTSATGLIISERNRARLSIAGIVFISLFLMFFVARFLYKHHNRTRRLKGMNFKREKRKFIKLEM